MSDKKLGGNAKFYTASAATYAALDDLQYGVERFNQFHKWCLDGVRKLTFTVLRDIHFVELEMTPWKSVNFPEDMVDWTKIGFRCGNTIKVFTSDKSISKISGDAPCPDIEIATVTDNFLPFYTEDLWYNGGNHYYGAICDYNHRGYFSADWKSRKFDFKNPVNNVNKVYLEYISDGINPTGKTVIHEYAFKALQYYIHWQHRLFETKKFSRGEAKEMKDIWENESDDALVNNLDISIDDLKEALRSNNTQTIKG
jgi:hypothetical protein